MAKCDHCGQDLPASPVLTLRQRIEALKDNSLGKGGKSIINDIADILLELEARPSVTFTPTLPPNGTGIFPQPWTPQPSPWPNTGDPVYPTLPKIICCNDVKSTVAMTSTPSAEGVMPTGNGLSD